MPGTATLPVHAVALGRRSGLLADTVRSEVRLVKTALLYADTVQSAWLTAGALDKVFHVVLATTRPARKYPHTVLDEVEPAVRAGLLVDADFPDDMSVAEGNLILQRLRGKRPPGALGIAYADSVRDFAPAPSRADWEGTLAAELLGALEGFPDAPMDVVLDVRERLTPARVHLRAALAQASKDLVDAEEAGEHAPDVVSDLRVRVVDPALAEIQEELTALHARRTLLRLASDRVALATAGTQLSIAAGAGGGLEALAAAAHAGLSAALVAAGFKEKGFREELVSQLRQRPYWMLHDASQAFNRS